MKASYKRWVTAIVTFAIGICSVGSISTPVYAKKTTLELLQEAKEEKEKTENAKESKENQKQSLEITKNSLIGQLSSLNDELAQVSTNLEGIESDIAAKEQDIEDTQAALEEAISIQDAQYANMKLRIKYMYENGGTSNYVSVLLSSESFADFVNKSDYIDRINQYDQKMLERFKQTRKEVEEKKAQLESELEDLNDLKAEVEAEKMKVSTLVIQTSENVSSYSNQIAEAEATIDALSSVISAQDDNIATLQKQYEEELAKSRLASQSSWRDISEVTFDEEDRKLLANLIYCEAGGEPYEGKVAVGAVVINRLLSSIFPNTVVGVIYQNKQFSPVNDGHLALALTYDKANSDCYKAADEAMSGYTNVGQCVYFRTVKEGINGIIIGNHVFY
jgi:spore germination cell wall hydrolase CwlJ-like protein